MHEPAVKGTPIFYPRNSVCGHKFVPGHEPRHRNCEACWFAFFQVHSELTEACDKALQDIGEAGLRQIRGPKFAANFLKFTVARARWNSVQNADKAGE